MFPSLESSMPRKPCKARASLSDLCIRSTSISNSHVTLSTGVTAVLAGSVSAALLPVQLLQRRLKVASVSDADAAVTSAQQPSAGQRDALLRLLWAAAACLAERCPLCSSSAAVTWLRGLSNRLAAAPPALGWAAVPGAALQQVVAVLQSLAAHPAANALALASQQLRQLLALDAAATAMLPQDLTRADAILPALAAAGALAAVDGRASNGAAGGAAAAALWQGIEVQAARLAAARGALAAHEQLLGAEAAAADALEWGSASLLQQSYWRHIHPKVSIVQAGLIFDHSRKLTAALASLVCPAIPDVQPVMTLMDHCGAGSGAAGSGT